MPRLDQDRRAPLRAGHLSGHVQTHADRRAEPLAAARLQGGGGGASMIFSKLEKQKDLRE